MQELRPKGGKGAGGGEERSVGDGGWGVGTPDRGKVSRWRPGV